MYRSPQKARSPSEGSSEMERGDPGGTGSNVDVDCKSSHQDHSIPKQKAYSPSHMIRGWHHQDTSHGFGDFSNLPGGRCLGGLPVSLFHTHPRQENDEMIAYGLLMSIDVYGLFNVQYIIV